VLNQPELLGAKLPFVLPRTLFRSMLEKLKLPLELPQSAERTEPERVMLVEVWENDIVIQRWVGSVRGLLGMLCLGVFVVGMRFVTGWNEGQEGRGLYR
jgi:hypothetical protein